MRKVYFQIASFIVVMNHKKNKKKIFNSLRKLILEKYKRKFDYQSIANFNAQINKVY